MINFSQLLPSLKSKMFSQLEQPIHPI